MSTAKAVNTLISYFISKHKESRGTPLVVNRYSVKWGVQDAMADLSVDRIKELIDFFFTTSRSKYDMGSFLSVYDQLDKARREQEKDSLHRVELREKTRLKVESLKEEDHG